MELSEGLLKEAHKHCAQHENEVKGSSVCGCFYCRTTFPAGEIKDWVDDEPPTAICPRCGVDSVIGDASRYPVDDPKFLSAMHSYWFNRTVTHEDGENG
jgi:hypothetical protein